MRVRAADGATKQAERTTVTDEGGNYSVELAPGSYTVCIARSRSKEACTRIDMPERGDKWVTTQMRDAVPDLSNLGNHAN